MCILLIDVRHHVHIGYVYTVKMESTNLTVLYICLLFWFYFMNCIFFLPFKEDDLMQNMK